MRPTILLRLAAGIELLFAIGHMLGGLKRWSPMGQNPVLDAMTSVRFNVMGASRSYLDFYLAFGWSLGITMLMQAVLLWQLAALSRTNPRQVRAMIAVIAVADLVTSFLAFKFLFLVPALFSLVLIIVLAAAWFVTKEGVEGERQ